MLKGLLRNFHFIVLLLAILMPSTAFAGVRAASAAGVQPNDAITVPTAVCEIRKAQAAEADKAKYKCTRED